MSRIHLSLGYEKLDDAAREQIWNNLFQKLVDDQNRGGAEIIYDYDAKCFVKTKEVHGLEWNGREIRNGEPPRSGTVFTDRKLLTSTSFPDRCCASRLRCEAKEERQTTQDHGTPPQRRSIYVVRFPKVHEGSAQRYGRLDMGLQVRKSRGQASEHARQADCSIVGMTLCVGARR